MPAPLLSSTRYAAASPGLQGVLHEMHKVVHAVYGYYLLRLFALRPNI